MSPLNPLIQGRAKKMAATYPEDFSSNIQAVGQKYPRLSQYLGNVAVQRGTTKDDRQLEYYAPWEGDNPNPGKSTIELYNKNLQGDDLTDSIALDLLHHIGGTAPNGQPVDPNYQYLKQNLANEIKSENRPMDRQAYIQDKKQYSDTGTYDDWLGNNRVDAYIRGMVSPRMNPEWAQPGVYTPAMKQIGSQIIQYLQQPGNPPQ